jgi:hypothetical protein
MSDELQCENCGVVLVDDAVTQAEETGYCPKCGEYFSEDDAIANDEAQHCDFCGGISIEGECDVCGEIRMCPGCEEHLPMDQFDIDGLCEDCAQDGVIF